MSGWDSNQVGGNRGASRVSVWLSWQTPLHCRSLMQLFWNRQQPTFPLQRCIVLLWNNNVTALS